MDELDKQQKFASGSVTNVAGTPVALAIRAGAPKPDISTVDALKRTLLAAKSIVYADKSFIQFLTGPIARPVFSAKGFQPAILAIPKD